jgi:para-aminobenzoate synthetase / 4-amino-4-deoxychorismate lyase
VTEGRSPDLTLGVFETVLVRDGCVQALDQHLSRLSASVAECYGASLPDDVDRRVRSEVGRLSGTHRVRVSAIGATITIDSEPVSAPPTHELVQLTPIMVSGGLGPHKWCDRRLLKALSADGAVPLLLDDGDELLEAAWANVWIIEGRRIVTPPTDGRVLPGVTRAMLLGLAGEIGVSAAVEPISLARARRAQAIFLTSAIRHAVGAAIAGDPPPAHEDPIVERARAALAATGWTSVKG